MHAEDEKTSPMILYQKVNLEENKSILIEREIG